MPPCLASKSEFKCFHISMQSCNLSFLHSFLFSPSIPSSPPCFLSLFETGFLCETVLAICIHPPTVAFSFLLLFFKFYFYILAKDLSPSTFPSPLLPPSPIHSSSPVSPQIQSGIQWISASHGLSSCSESRHPLLH